MTTTQSGRGSSSGVAVTEPVFQLFTDREEALEAAGLRLHGEF